MIIVIVIVALAAFGWLIGLAVFGSNRAAARTREATVAGAHDIYADLFDGSATAVYVSHDAALPVDMVNEAADRHGYEVVTVQPGGSGFNAQTITYRRRADAPPPPEKPPAVAASPAEAGDKWAAKKWIGPGIFFVTVLVLIVVMDMTS